jgi:hypothetical protein
MDRCFLRHTKKEKRNTDEMNYEKKALQKQNENTKKIITLNRKRNQKKMRLMQIKKQRKKDKSKE